MEFQVAGRRLVVEPEALIVAGFTGRDDVAVKRHLEELARDGIAPPQSIPCFYVLSPDGATQEQRVVVLHEHTSGEAEVALLTVSGDVYVTLASDHTDRRAETQDIALSKQVCPKVLAHTAWPYEEVADHWDQLQLRSWIEHDGTRRLYQEGTTASLLPPADLLGRLAFHRTPQAWVLLGGTVPAVDGIRHSPRFWAELHDPATNRTIDLHYTVSVLNPLQHVTA